MVVYIFSVQLLYIYEFASVVVMVVMIMVTSVALGYSA